MGELGRFDTDEDDEDSSAPNVGKKEAFTTNVFGPAQNIQNLPKKINFKKERERAMSGTIVAVDPNGERVLLTPKELKETIPDINFIGKGRIVVKLKQLDRAFELYYVGYKVPELDETDKKESSAVWWFDLARGAVKQYDHAQRKWLLVPAEVNAPRLVFDSRGRCVGYIEDLPAEKQDPSVKRSLKDILSDDI